VPLVDLNRDKTTIGAYEIFPNATIYCPIGIVLTVENLYDVLNFSSIFSKHKKGIDINRLLKAGEL